MANNYDNAAWFYDSLSQLVFGKAIVKAQIYLLQHILPESNLLIVGGGTGWILEELANVHPHGLRVSYVEISSKMLSLAQKKDAGNNEIIFIHSAIEDVRLAEKFDVIITPFLFDSFGEATLQKAFGSLHQQLKPDGVWLYADFMQTAVWWQRILLRAMLIFFRLLCGIEARQLPDVTTQFGPRDYQVVTEKTFFGGFIAARVYGRVKAR